MTNKILSVFIDESGDFGPYDSHAPDYLVSMVLHNQSISLSETYWQILGQTFSWNPGYPEPRYSHRSPIRPGNPSSPN